MSRIEAAFEQVCDGVARARIVRQAVGSPSSVPFALVAHGDAFTLDQAGGRVVPVPPAWISSIKLEGVAADRLVFTVAEAGGRTAYVLDGDGCHTRIGRVEDQLVVCGDHLYQLAADGVRRMTTDGEADRVSHERATAVAASDSGEVVVAVTAAGGVMLRTGAAGFAPLPIGTALRPEQVTLCPASCHLLVVGRTVTGRQAWTFDVTSRRRLAVVDVDRHATLVDGCRLLAIDHGWPYADLIESDVDGRGAGPRPLHASVAALIPSRAGVAAHWTRPGQPLSLSSVVSVPGNGRPAFAYAPVLLATSAGRLRDLRTSPDLPRGHAVLLHGGPYGVWRPGWDPIVELLRTSGYAVHLLEAPYTASLRGDHHRFRAGDFGVCDVDSVREAVEQIADEAPGPVLLFGHSYGALLAARVAAYAPERIAGLFMMSAVWRTADLQRLVDGAGSAPSSLRGFLAYAFPSGRVPLPEPRLPADLPVAVVHGADDGVVPIELAERAAAAGGFALTRLEGEGHVPIRGSSIRAVLAALRDWLHRCEEER